MIIECPSCGQERRGRPRCVRCSDRQLVDRAVGVRGIDGLEAWLDAALSTGS